MGAHAHASECPRDRAALEEIHQGNAHIDRCTRCQGTFFDQGEMFLALGRAADPSVWDRPGVTGMVRDGPLACPACHHPMRIQDLKHQELHVEIDRCTKCSGIWLDHGEAEKLLSIGTHMVGKVIEEQRKAQAELDKMEVDLAPAGLIASFLGLFK